MKKIPALLLSLLFLTGCASAVYDGPTESAWVLTEQTTTFPATANGQDATSKTVYAYDSWGNQVQVLSYLDGELETEYEYRYDDRGNRISSVTRDHFWVFSFPTSRIGYTYDEQNRPLTTVYRNGFFLKTGSDTYTYDDEANTVTWDGTYDTQTKYLNENGDIIRSVSFSEPAGMEIETLYEYDELSRNTKTTEYLDGVLSSTAQMRYDDQGRILENVWHDADGTIIDRTTFQYTENTITTWDLDGYKSVRTLRPDGQVEKLENFDREGNLRSRTDYTYTEIQIPAKEE